MTLPEPWNDKNNCFAKNFNITQEQLNNINSIDTDNTTFIRSNLSITNGENTTIPNVFEAINTQYALIFNALSEINSIKEQISTISTSIESMQKQIEELKPSTQ